LAEKLDLSWQYISNVECGHRGISLDTLVNLCEIFQVPADYFLFGEKDPNDLTEINGLLASVNPKWLPHLKDVMISFISSCQNAISE
ncbi:MAG: helix-turn-helix transcriptional regulator, partial [Clostridiales bacterium]|nr:helix-turn-helix transcriptional regulator [Clostridiales bacterium]